MMSETQSFSSCRSDWKVHWRGEKLWSLQGACGSGWERDQDADGHGGQERASWPGTCHLCGEVMATQEWQWRADAQLVLLDRSCCSECKLRHCGGVCLPLLVVGFCAITVRAFSCYKSTQTGLHFCFSWFGLVVISRHCWLMGSDFKFMWADLWQTWVCVWVCVGVCERPRAHLRERERERERESEILFFFILFLFLMLSFVIFVGPFCVCVCSSL